MKIKKLLIILIFGLFYTNNSFAQSLYKWRSSLFSFRQITTEREWTKWTDWQTSSLLITVDPSAERVKIYSANNQVYDFIDQVAKNYDSKGNPIYSVNCISNKGETCRMVWYHNSIEGSYVILEYAEFELMYRVYLLD